MKFLLEVALSLALVGAWGFVALTASEATQVEGAPSAQVEAAVAASAPRS